MATTVQDLIKREKRGKNRQKEYSDAYVRMMDTAKNNLFRNVTQFVRRWF